MYRLKLASILRFQAKSSSAQCHQFRSPAWKMDCPTDVDNLWGDPTKAKTVLGWNPQQTSYEELCAIMAEYDLQLAKWEKAAQQA